MKHDSPLQRVSLLVAGAVLFGLGFVLGDGRQPAEARGTGAVRPAAADGGETSAALDRLSAELAALREEAAMRATRWEELLRTRTQARPAREPSASSEAPLAAGFDAAALEAWFEELDERLDGIVHLQRRLAAAPRAGTAAEPTLTLPAGMDVRDYLRTLRWVDDGEEVVRAHQLWDTSRVRQTYGPPDEVVDHEDYVEWIYRLGEDEQFDFHFVNGLCVQAH